MGRNRSHRLTTPARLLILDQGFPYTTKQGLVPMRLRYSCARVYSYQPDWAHEAVAQRGPLELILTTPKTADDARHAQPATSVRRRILIVDDHPLVRRGLRSPIDSEPDLRVCAEAATHREGMAALTSARPHLVIADLSLGDSDGLEMVKDIRASHEYLPVLVLSMHDAPIHAERAFRAGANGYASKQEMGETLLVAIRCVLGGETYMSPKIRAGLDGK